MDSHDSHAELVGRLTKRCKDQEDQIADLKRHLDEERNR